MNRIHPIAVFLICLWAFTSKAQLVVSVSPPKITAQKAVVSLAMTNHLAESVESARAICFLLDENGRMVGQSAKWVIGEGKDHQSLQPKTGTTYNFVITNPKSIVSTNLSVKVSFSRLVLEGGKQVDPAKNVSVSATQSSP
jgi:hypothetical protein